MHFKTQVYACAPDKDIARRTRRSGRSFSPAVAGEGCLEILGVDLDHPGSSWLANAGSDNQSCRQRPVGAMCHALLGLNQSLNFVVTGGKFLVQADERKSPLEGDGAFIDMGRHGQGFRVAQTGGGNHSQFSRAGRAQTG